jgi:hypothetical protein
MNWACSLGSKVRAFGTSGERGRSLLDQTRSPYIELLQIAEEAHGIATHLHEELTRYGENRTLPSSGQRVNSDLVAGVRTRIEEVVLLSRAQGGELPGLTHQLGTSIGRLREVGHAIAAVLPRDEPGRALMGMLEFVVVEARGLQDRLEALSYEGSESRSMEFQRPLTLVPGHSGPMEVENCRLGFTDGRLDRPVFGKIAVSPALVQDVYVWLEHFPPELIAAQTGLVFLLKEAIQGPGPRGDRTRGIVICAEARLGSTGAFSMVRGAASQYGLVHVASSLEDRLEYGSQIRGRRISHHRLRLSDLQKRMLLRTMLERSSARELHEKYHTITNNCIVNVMEYLNAVLRPAQRLPLLRLFGLALNPGIMIPTLAPAWLRLKGLIDRSSHFERGASSMEFALSTGGSLTIRSARG